MGLLIDRIVVASHSYPLVAGRFTVAGPPPPKDCRLR
jgi:hypothetical protein